MALVSRRVDLHIRSAREADLPELRRLIEMSSRVHLHLDWWTLEDWVDNPGFLVAQSGARIVGLGLGVRDASPVAWLRVLVVEDGLGASVFLDAILPPTLNALRLQGAPALACLAWAEWLAARLPERGFAPMTRVMTLRKASAAMPDRMASDVFVREAGPADIDAITAIDHAAFGIEWQYGAVTFLRVLRSSTRFVVAERNGESVGYAVANLDGSHAHITRLGVPPIHQRQGIGTRLLVDLVAHSMMRGVDAITLNTQTDNEDALRLYRRFGFAPVGSAVTAWRISLVVS